MIINIITQLTKLTAAVSLNIRITNKLQVNKYVLQKLFITNCLIQVLNTLIINKYHII